MKIREMKEKDLDAVLDVIALNDEDDAEAAEAYLEEFFEALEEQREEGDVDEDDEIVDRHFVAVNDDGKILGVGGVMEDPEEGDGIWWLGWFYIHPQQQHQGLGEKLLERSLAWVREEDGRKLYVDVSSLDEYENARAFYHKHGFVEEGRLQDFYAEGEDMIIMGRRV